MKAGLTLPPNRFWSAATTVGETISSGARCQPTPNRGFSLKSSRPAAANTMRPIVVLPPKSEDVGRFAVWSVAATCAHDPDAEDTERDDGRSCRTERSGHQKAHDPRREHEQPEWR